MARGVDLRVASTHDRDGDCARVERAAMRGTINANRQSADDREPCTPEFCRQRPGKIAASHRRSTATDDSDIQRTRQRRCAATYEERDRWVRRRRQRRREIRIDDPKHMNLQPFDFASVIGDDRWPRDLHSKVALQAVSCIRRRAAGPPGIRDDPANQAAVGSPARQNAEQRGDFIYRQSRTRLESSRSIEASRCSAECRTKPLCVCAATRRPSRATGF